MDKQMIIVAGDSGVYVGMADGGVSAVGSDGRVMLTGARHLRRYYVAGRKGDGSAGDLAVLGVDAAPSSISEPVPGETLLLGVRRAFAVTAEAQASFGVLS